MYCLWCDQTVIPEISWKNIWLMGKTKRLCSSCENALEVIGAERCKKCSRLFNKEICPDCLQWQKKYNEDPLTFNQSVFKYNEQMQDIVSRWKYRGDYYLTFAFEQLFIEFFKATFSFLPKKTFIVPIPLSRERMLERGFNQAKVLADFLTEESKDIMERVHTEKQSKKTREQRLTTKNPFTMTKRVNNPVILVDDIYTTGSTLRHAANLLKENGCPKVYAFTLIRG